MGRFVKGDVVVIPFPFSNLTGNKRRPALILVDLNGDDCIICQITSKNRSDPLAIPLTATDFSSGRLPVDSFIRPNKIFTADKNLILSTVGHLTDKKISDVINAVIAIIQPHSA
jgi:mRNA interferase MazF